jgi:hypothetical protein
MADFDWNKYPKTQVEDFDWSAHPVIESAPSNEESFGKKIARGAIDSLPLAGAIGGGLVAAPINFVAPGVASVAGAGLGYAGGKELSDFLKNRLLGDEATSTDPLDQAKRVGGNFVDGTTAEMGGQIAGKALQSAMPAIKSGTQFVGDKLKGAAEKFAVNATGATGNQASKFADDAGRKLLDKKLVQFGDTPEKVAQRVGSAKDMAGSNIDEALTAMDAQGVTANNDNVVAALRQEVDILRQDPSQAGVVKKLETILEDIAQTGKARIPISQGEKIKRGFNKAAGNWMDPEASQAGKKAYLSYMDEVERAAQAENPAMASLFKEGKETYGLLSPIEEAASKRAMTQNQSPIGGLGDFAAIGAGGAAGGIPGALAGVVAKKYVAPRVSSSAAVSLDKVSQSLLRSPQMAELYAKNPQIFNSIAQKMEERMSSRVAENEKKAPDSNALLQKTQGTQYAEVLQNASKRGQNAVGAAHFVLQSTDPNYRQLFMDEERLEDEQ